MDTSLLDKAKARRSELEQEIKELDDFIALTEKMGLKFSAIPPGPPAPPEPPLRHAAPPPPPAYGSLQQSPTEEILSAVEQILTLSDRPMRPAELVELLRQENVVITGKNPNNNLSAKLSNAGKRFISIPGRGWKLKAQRPDWLS